MKLPGSTTLVYVLTRALGLLLLLPQTDLLADFTHLGVALHQAGAAGAVFEYPWLAAALYELPLRLGASTWWRYYASMIALFLLLDAAFAFCLWRAGGRRATPGYATWLWLFPALGPLLVTRFDVLSGALVGCALLAHGAARRPVVAGALAALGAGFKLWPAISLPALLVPGARFERRGVIAGAALAALAAGALTVLAAGWERLWSPFVFQASRGLQIEAFAALPLLWAHHAGGLAGSVILHAPECKCHEIRAAATAGALSLAAGARWLGLAGLALLFVRALRAPEAARSAALAAQLTALSVIIWIATNKAFSPQYMVWVAAPLAALGVLQAGPSYRTNVALLLLACALTQYVFPSSYDALVAGGREAAPALTVLTLRDLLVLTLGARLALDLWRDTRT